MSPSAKILTFSAKRRPCGEYDRFPSGVPMWHELDRIWSDALLEAVEEYRERRAALAVADDAGGGP